MVKHIYTSVDIGSDTIKIVVFELCKNKLNLLAASSTKTRGVKKGLIVDFEEAAFSLKKAFSDVEDMLGVKIKKVIASVPSYFSDYIKIEESIDINNDEGIVTSKEINDLFQKCVHSTLAPNREMVTIVPIDFRVDDGDMVSNPRGLSGNTLATRVIMVTTPTKNIYSVANLIEHLGVEVVDISLNGIGDIYTFKNADMESSVGAIVNIGSEITSVTLYNKCIAVKNAIIQYGGKSIENDISYMYKVDANVARDLKENFAVAHKKGASANEFREVVDIYGNTKKINQFEISEIVMSRIEQIMLLVKEQINILTNREIKYIILTGGTSNMPHIKAVANEILGDTTVGNIRVIGVRNNKYSSAIGNIIYFINKLKLKGNNYSMMTRDDENELSSTKRGHANSNETMLGKVFGYFFGE